MNRKAQQEFQGQVVDAVATGAALYLVYTYPEYLNPWKLSALHWICGGIVIRAAIAFYDHFVIFLIDSVFKNRLLPTRTTGKPVRYVELDTKSVIYLTINAVNEWIFVQQFCHFIWHSPDVSLDWREIGFFNTVGALWIIFFVMDVVYAPVHHLLHMPFLYPLIHKHHHRQHFPVRGYLDAGNVHPIEHSFGVVCNWVASLAAVHAPTGVHGVALFAFFNIHAALAMLNHSPYDVKFNIIPGGLLEYNVAHHEMHHRKFTVNYAQYSMWYDYAAKTYAPYEGPTTAKQL